MDFKRKALYKLKDATHDMEKNRKLSLTESQHTDYIFHLHNYTHILVKQVQ